MDYDLNRSVRLLEDSLTTQGRNFLLTGTPKSKEKPKAKQTDLSVTLTPHEVRRLFEKEGLGDISYNRSFTNLVEGDKTLAGSVLRVNEPWKATADSLYLEFYETLQSHSHGHEIFEIVADLARCCSDALQVIKGLKTKASILKTSEEQWLEDERNTWRLLYVLYQDRLNSQDMSPQEQNIYFGTSEKQCILSLLKNDDLVRESQLVIDWLEYNASERDIEALHFSDSSVGWENTLHQLQSVETIVFESSRKTVTSLHPDAPHFEHLPLHDLDISDDNRLCRKVFQEIRCGKLDQAKKLCINCGHAWRAAILEGWRLYHNPNTVSEKQMDELMDQDASGSELIVGDVITAEENLQTTEGNETRDIWKDMAFAYCQKQYLNPYERAAVAAYCGNVQTLLLVCENWEDGLWAYMKVLVDIRVESEIRDSISRNYQPMPDEYWDQKMSLNEVFKHLESSANSAISSEAQMDVHIIQKYVILDEVPKLMEAISEWLERPHVTTQFLRFLTHVILFLEQIGQAHRQDVSKRVLESYVNRLCEMNETCLIAYYVSKLGSQEQVQLFASYLERILENEERKAALCYGEDSGLNTQAVTKQIVENIRSRPHEVGAFGNLQERITDIDLLKISAIDWLLIYETQKLEALEQTNALIFTFLTLKKLDAAQLAFNKIPPNTVDSVLSEGELLPDINQIIREYLSYKAYLDAHEAFNVWFKQFSSKPIPPDDLPENAHFTEKVAHQHRVSQFKAETERWKLSTSHSAKTAKIKLYNVLLFPEGGWLSGAKDGEFLRSTCIPEIVLLLYSVLNESGYHEECIQLADILASDKYGLYKVFSKEKIADVLIKLCESSVLLLNEQKDAWGNVTTE